MASHTCAVSSLMNGYLNLKACTAIKKITIVIAARIETITNGCIARFDLTALPLLLIKKFFIEIILLIDEVSKKFHSIFYLIIFLRRMFFFPDFIKIFSPVGNKFIILIFCFAALYKFITRPVLNHKCVKLRWL